MICLQDEVRLSVSASEYMRAKQNIVINLLAHSKIVRVVFVLYVVGRAY